jgi:hypothetical protein
MEFNKKNAEQYIDALLKQHNITVAKWSVASCGWANIKERCIKIPKPTNVDRFAVCLHEIKHIIDGNWGERFQLEFACDKFALDTLTELGYDTTEWYNTMKCHALSYIAKAHNKGTDLSKMNTEIRRFFEEVDFSKWVGKKVFFPYEYDKPLDPNSIELRTPRKRTTLRGSKVEKLLKKKCLTMIRLICINNRCVRWLVQGGNSNQEMEFWNLQDIVDYYQLKEYSED